eukprot:TRINITY_DN13897_c0_g1_i3.p1 TRINITY_DN13897_c0_g1~~TRINITY_DN13897_c0_g1_i3.p1  ORF type:complete len:139 (+),score=18.26 TRINITY_DN13897_c0_g1_i3:459-875(+)
MVSDPPSGFGAMSFAAALAETDPLFGPTTPTTTTGEGASPLPEEGAAEPPPARERHLGKLELEQELAAATGDLAATSEELARVEEGYRLAFAKNDPAAVMAFCGQLLAANRRGHEHVGRCRSFPGVQGRVGHDQLRAQ